MADGPIPSLELLYSLNDRPPWGRILVYALQWLIIFLPILTLSSILAAEMLDLGPSGRVAYFQRLSIITGLTIVLQTLLGHQLPLIDGPSSALIITLATLAPSGEPVIAGGMIVGGFLLFLCGSFRLMRLFVPLFTDLVVGVILLLIGLTMLPYLLPMLMGQDTAHPSGQPLVLGLGLFLVLVMAMFSHYLKGLYQSLSLFWGVILGTVIFGFLGLIDLTSFKTASWVTIPRLIPDQWPKFDPVAGFSFALAYLAVLVNLAGSLFSLEPIVGADRIDSRGNRGMIMTGLSGILAGATSVVGTVPYSLSPGIITVTRVGSRYILTACGCILITLAFSGKLVALLASIPDAVVGAALLASMGAAVGISMEIIHRGCKTLSTRDCLVVGLPVLIGTSTNLLPEALLNQLPASIKPLAGNGLIVGVVLVLLLEHVLLRKKRN